MLQYNAIHEAKTQDIALASAEATFNFWTTCAKLLGITLEEYIDFVQDMELMERTDYSLEELEQMYVDYCREYDIPCMQIAISNPMALMGAI